MGAQESRSLLNIHAINTTIRTTAQIAFKFVCCTLSGLVSKGVGVSGSPLTSISREGSNSEGGYRATNRRDLNISATYLFVIAVTILALVLALE